jgi:hypothetical protein
MLLVDAIEEFHITMEVELGSDEDSRGSGAYPSAQFSQFLYLRLSTDP